MAIAVKDRVASRRQTERTKLCFTDPSAYLGLRQVGSRVMRHRWECVRQVPTSTSRSVRPRGVMYACVSCNAAPICRRCALGCHRGHLLDLYKQQAARLCECGLSGGCSLLPAVLEDVPEAWGRLALHVQRLFRGHRVRAHMRWYHRRKLEMRKEVCERAWKEQVMAPVWERVTRVVERIKRETELALMAQADKESRAAAHYLKLQKALKLMNSQTAVLRTYVTLGRCWPKRPLQAGPLCVEPFPFSTRQQLRQHLRSLPMALRPPFEQLVRLTRDLPAYGRVVQADRMTPDPDMAQLVRSAKGEITTRRRRASLAGPEGLYGRLRRFDGQLRLRLDIARRQSFDEGARVDKADTAQDAQARARAEGYIEGVTRSLGLAEQTLLEEEAAERLSKNLFLGTPEGGKEYQDFARLHTCPGIGQDLQRILMGGEQDEEEEGSSRRVRRRRRYSFAAPERLRRHGEVWREGERQEQAIITAATRECYPVRRQSWTWRLDRTKPLDREPVVEKRDWVKESERLAIQAKMNGWDLDPEPPPSSAPQEAQGQDTGFGEGKNTADSEWQAYTDEASGMVYFYNATTGESTWEPPATSGSSWYQDTENKAYASDGQYGLLYQGGEWGGNQYEYQDGAASAYSGQAGHNHDSNAGYGAYGAYNDQPQNYGYGYDGGSGSGNMYGNDAAAASASAWKQSG
jgi:hypothetical protein